MRQFLPGYDAGSRRSPYGCFMTSLAGSLGLAAASGAFTLIDPEAWPRSVRTAYVVLPAVGLASYTAYQMANNHGEDATSGPHFKFPGAKSSTSRISGVHAAAPKHDDPAISPSTIALTSAGLGLGAAALGAASFPVDRGIRNLVARTGTKYPRRWMAVGVVVLCLVLDAADRRSRDA